VSYVAVGRIVGAYGQQGWVRAEPLTDFPERFAKLERLYISRDPADDFPLPLRLERAEHVGNSLVLVFTGITDEIGAEGLVGSYLLVPESERFPLPPNRYYIDDLIGLTVVETSGVSVGQVTEVINNPGNDLLLIRTSAGNELLLPMVKSFVHQIDLAGKVITVTIPPGLEEL